MAIILNIQKGSIARSYGLKEGYDLIAFNGMPIHDILDYIYMDSLSDFTLTYTNHHGKLKTKRIVKDESESLGIDIGEEFKLNPVRCKNKCIFCFVDQMRKGMRDTLYVKDDDYRLSFICGNYVTLTNVTDEDIARIVSYKLSPMYISVHAIDDDVRKFIVKNPNTLKLKGYLDRLNSAGIKMHTQVVMVEGVNDGAVLEETISYLSKLENVCSLAIVPVGLSGYRKGLESLNTVSKSCAAATVELVERYNKALSGFCWCSDEMYLLADLPLPSYDYYGDFCQLENGIGLIADFRYELDQALANADKLDTSKRYLLVTGVSFAPILTSELDKVKSKFPELQATVKAIVNDYFGHTITVAGLTTATDIIAQTKDIIDEYDIVIVPHNMLREFSDVFLDNISITELEASLGVKVAVASSSGDGIIHVMKGEY